MRKFAGWVAAVLLVMAFAAVEWQPWDWLNKSQVSAGRASSSQDAGVQAQAVVQATTQAKPTAAGGVPDNAQANASASSAPVLQRPAIRAELTPVHDTILAAEINAKVQSLPFKEGQAFEKGAVLVAFDCVVQKAQLARVRAEREIAQRNARTNERLLKLGNISRVEAENALSEFARAQAQFDELAAIVSKCEITAPYAGKVAERRAGVEQFVQVGQPVLEILDDSGLELEFIAPSKWAPWLEPGHGFTIAIEETAKTYPARVMRVAARIDSVSQTFKVVAQIDGKFSELTPGMSGTITVSPP